MRKSKLTKITKRKTQKRAQDSEVRAHSIARSSHRVAELHSDPFETKLSQLENAKKTFLNALDVQNSKLLTPSEKLNVLVAKAEKLATFLITKHRYFE